MKEWLKENQKPVGIAVGLLLLYVLHWFPQLEAERELVVGILAAFGFIGTVAVPKFAKPEQDSGGDIEGPKT